MVLALGIEPRFQPSKGRVLPLDEARMAKVVGFEPTIAVLETAALGQLSYTDVLVRGAGIEPAIC